MREEKLRGDRRWIPVTERLPEVWRDAESKGMIDYLIFMPDFGVSVGNYGALFKQWFYMGIPVNVTHWMPLPEAPEVEE